MFIVLLSCLEMGRVACKTYVRLLRFKTMSKNSPVFHALDPRHTDPARLKRERNRASELKQSPWWKQKIKDGICHYCRKKFSPGVLTMDHVIPLARGGESIKNNVVPACKACNASKKLDTPVDDLFAQLERERLERDRDE